MKRGIIAYGVACSVVLAGAAPAVAQTTPDQVPRVFVNVGVGYQNADRTFKDGGSFDLYEEKGSFTGDHPIKGGVCLDVGGGVRFLTSLGVGVTYTRVSNEADVPLKVTVPHPLFFNQPRTTELTATQLGHAENAVHIQAMYFVPLTDTIDLAVGAGPSVIAVRQEVVTGIATFTEGASPYTSVTASGVQTSRQSKTVVGFNVGADVAVMLRPRIGAGAFVRYAKATVTLATDGDSSKLGVGGIQVGVGLRLRF